MDLQISDDPKFIPPIVKAASECVHELKGKLSVVTFEALPQSEYVDPFLGRDPTARSTEDWVGGSHRVQ